MLGEFDQDYTGNWVNDKKHGYGVLKNRGQDFYKGNWVEDYYGGHGIQYLGNTLDYYKGQFYEHLKHGSGEFYFSEYNIRLQCEMDNDYMEGHCKKFNAGGMVHLDGMYRLDKLIDILLTPEQ